ncbi:MAG: hypothetical protein LBD93_01465 [Treponema sp.]|jgi:hypothetical protein|nr:hypothetical protein [Treponema sp.]
MKQLRADYAGTTLTRVWDHAAYQRCGNVTQYAKEHAIGLLFLPPFSLHLRERSWKVVKAKVPNPTCQGTGEDFKRTITACYLDPYGIDIDLDELLLQPVEKPDALAGKVFLRYRSASGVWSHKTMDKPRLRIEKGPLTALPIMATVENYMRSIPC